MGRMWEVSTRKSDKIGHDRKIWMLQNQQEDYV